MSLKLEYRFNQKLTISHRMQQSLSLLSLSQEELNQAIQQELMENPLLETVESTDSSLFDSKKAEFSSFKRPNTLNTSFVRPESHSNGFIEDFLTEPVSLKSYVLKQVEMSCFPRKIKLILPLLISYLDERAYLNLDLKELTEKENISLNLLEAALSALQSLEPSGLAGRDLKECLLIQLRQKKENTEKACLIVRNHLENLKDKKYTVIAHDLNLSFEETLKLCRLIQSLEPNPGRSFSSQPTVFVQPDLYIYKEGQRYSVFLNKDSIPDLRFSYKYAKLISCSGKLKPEEKKYLSEKTTAAHWFIRAIQQRQEKIQKIAEYLITHQRDFFEKGRSHLKPLKMQDLADYMAVHVSTVSRVVSHKYAYTPQGIMALKYFFQKGLITKNGDSVSLLKIKESIKKWINDEEPHNPLSDGQLQSKIQEEFHVYLLRRSIGQYRASMGIPPLRVRKLNFLNLQRFENLKIEP